MEATPPALTQAGVAPSLDQLVLHAGGDVPDNAKLGKLIENFARDSL
jgi:hypothetical protein